MLNFVLAGHIPIIICNRSFALIQGVMEFDFVSVHTLHRITPQAGMTAFSMEGGTSPFHSSSTHHSRCERSVPQPHAYSAYTPQFPLEGVRIAPVLRSHRSDTDRLSQESCFPQTEVGGQHFVRVKTSYHGLESGQLFFLSHVVAPPFSLGNLVKALGLRVGIGSPHHITIADLLVVNLIRRYRSVGSESSSTLVNFTALVSSVRAAR